MRDKTKGCHYQMKHEVVEFGGKKPQVYIYVYKSIYIGIF